jgi:hypothetical protein
MLEMMIKVQKKNDYSKDKIKYTKKAIKASQKEQMAKDSIG